MPRTRRPRARGKPRNIPTNSPAVSTNTAVATPPPSRRTAAAPAASANNKVSGRTTQNSRGNRGRSRGPGSARKNIGRNGSSRGRGRLPKKDPGMQDPSFYKDDDGEVYKRGGV